MRCLTESRNRASAIGGGYGTESSHGAGGADTNEEARRRGDVGVRGF